MGRKEDLIFLFQGACRKITYLSIQNPELQFIPDSNVIVNILVPLWSNRITGAPYCQEVIYAAEIL